MKSSIKIVIQHLSGQDKYVLITPGQGWARVLQTPKDPPTYLFWLTLVCNQIRRNMLVSVADN